MAKLTASASGTNRNLATAGQKNIGMKTMQMQSVKRMRHGDLLRTVEDRLDRFLAHRQVAVDVFDFYVASSTRMPTGECEPAKRHDIDWSGPTR